MLVNFINPTIYVLKVLDSISDTEGKDKKKKPKKMDLPSPLRKKLKLNLKNLPTPKDDEYIFDADIYHCIWSKNIEIFEKKIIKIF